MKKYKLHLISLIVFLTVFSLTTITDLRMPVQESEDKESIAKDTHLAEPETLAEITEEPVIHSFAYKLDDSSYEQTVVDAFSVLDASETEDDDDILMNSSEASLTPTPEASPMPQATPTPEPKAESKYSNIGISVAKDYVNIRAKASTDSDIVGKLYRNSACEILDSEDGWYHIESGSVKGYVNSDFIKTKIPDEKLIKEYGTLSISVESDGLNVREGKSTESKKLSVIYMNEIYPVLEDEGEWIKIQIPDEDITGYVKSEFCELIVKFTEAVSKEEEELLSQLAAEKKAKEETTIKKRDSTNYDYDDLQLLACLIHSEAGSQSYETKLAVANVVLNRMKSSAYPNSMKAVIYQSGQFTVAASGSLQKQLDNYDNYKSKAQLMSIKAAKDALAGSNNIGKRVHFNSYRAACNKGYDEKSTAVKMEGLLFW